MPYFWRIDASQVAAYLQSCRLSSIYTLVIAMMQSLRIGNALEFIIRIVAIWFWFLLFAVTQSFAYVTPWGD